MTRRHHDPVVVRVADGTRPGTARGGAGSTMAGTSADPTADGPRDPTADPTAGWPTDPTADGPRDFVWRGRRYTVCAVLASWQERRAWWREVGDDPAGPGMPSPQRRVWRVEARPPSGTAGVFDLGRDDDHWLLLRAHD
ncbi:MAG TPA: DUF6504 family protein [Ornithinibacter sp.]|nr:DUF6504 family protein [Ornithinibacter sp.]